MNEYNTRISKEDLKKLILSNRTEIDKTIREATDYLDTLHQKGARAHVMCNELRRSEKMACHVA